MGLTKKLYDVLKCHKESMEHLSQVTRCTKIQSFSSSQGILLVWNQLTSLPSDFSEPLLITKSLVADPDETGEASFSFDPLPVGVERLTIEGL